jgi:glucose/arabinose dehydrogenase/mono/diheme cytochrome c family protein
MKGLLRIKSNIIAGALIGLGLVAGLSGCNNPKLPSPDSDNGGLILPDGFSALVVVDSVGPTRHIAVSDRGDIYAKLKITAAEPGNIAMRDTSGDGRMDIIKAWGNYPNDGSFATEMRIHNGYLYYSSEQVVYRQKLENDLIPGGTPEVIMRDHHPRQWHNAKSLAFDNDGGMYVTFSAPTNVCENWMEQPSNSSAYISGEFPCSQLVDQSGIWRFDADKPEQVQSDGIKFARGLRSVVAIAWNPEDQNLYAAQHGRDYLYGHAPHLYTPWQNAILPAEEFIRVKEGEDYGWPYSYYDPFKKKRILAPEYGGDGESAPEQFKFADPLMGMPAHWAPNDLLFYKGDQFPSRYKQGAFIAFHGSTNRSPYPQAGYIVGFIPFENGKPTGAWEIFADGFAGTDTIKEMSQAKYRPMGLAEGPDGSLYISESTKGKVWRVMFTGDRKSFGESSLRKMEERKSMSYVKTPDETADNLSLRDPVNPAFLYSAYCASCHQQQGEGVQYIYPPLAKSDWVNGNQERYIRTVLHGLNGEIKVNKETYNQIMPRFDFLSDHQLAELLTYIKTDFGNIGGKILPAEVKQLRLSEKK